MHGCINCPKMKTILYTVHMRVLLCAQTTQAYLYFANKNKVLLSSCIISPSLFYFFLFFFSPQSLNLIPRRSKLWFYIVYLLEGSGAKNFSDPLQVKRIALTPDNVIDNLFILILKVVFPTLSSGCLQAIYNHSGRAGCFRTRFHKI